jgi:hypothetical protein
MNKIAPTKGKKKTEKQKNKKHSFLYGSFYVIIN